ncbi:MAG: hypothetical protein ACJ8LI_04975 [Chthoniobacterales bacterium]
MNMRLTLCCAVVCLFALGARAAEPGSWAGEYTDKKFLNGSATFQLSIEQSGGKTQVSFDAVNNDGGGCAPEAQGMATASGKDKLTFNFRDNEGNAGTGTITRSGDDVVVSLKATKVAKQDCTKFYRDNIRLKRAKK